MRSETLAEMKERILAGAGEQEESLSMWETVACFTITVSTGHIVAEKREIAEAMAIFRAEQQIEVRGNGCSVEKEAFVRRIGPA